MTMLDRYSRALRLTAPKVAAATPGNAVDGYWLDDDQFFFLAEKIDPSIRRMLAIPSIANARTGSVQEAVPFATLMSLLSDCSRQAVDLMALSSAEFDMPDRQTLCVSVAGRDYRIDAQARRVVEASTSSEFPALYSPDGRYACYVNGNDIWLRERATGAERPLTSGGTAYRCYGRQSESCLMTISYRERPYPVGLWSPDSQWFLTHRIDEESLPESAVIQHAPPGGGRPVLHRFKYCMADDPMPIATFVAIHIGSGRVATFDDFPAPVMAFSPFSYRTIWFDGADTAWFASLDRYSKRADLIELKLGEGTGRVVLSETTDSGYLDLHPFLFATPNVRTLAASNEIVWFSERDGWGHLYLYDAATGRLKNRITTGQWLVRDIAHVDPKQRKLLFLAGGIDPEADPARRSLCSVNFDGSNFEVLLEHAGDVFVPLTTPCGIDQSRPFRPSYSQPGVSPDGHFGAVRYGSVERGNRTEIVDLRTRHGFAIASATPGSDEEPARHFTALAADGATRLHGVMFLPSDFDESQRYPLIDDIYPGPQLAHQPQSFRSMWSAQARALAELGFVTIMLDSRGIPTGSRAVHQIGYPELLEPQLADHAAVVRQLCERHPFIDGQHIGMIGWSAGGFATARSLCDYGEIFKVGVAACGNHDSTYYSTVWSDKYRGPGDREAWSRQANRAAAHKLAGKLLLISGDLDENVHMSHTLSLVDALIQANKDFDLLIVPNEAHYLMMSNGYAQRRAWDYFVRNMLGETPPPNFEIRFEPHELAHWMKSYWREFQQ
jgi:dipeptidyl aminopeptidase/acylaminoacyl peptidase